MEIFISIAGKIAEYTVAPIGRQVGYLIFYKENFEDLHVQVQELKGVRDQTKHRIEAERRNGREIEGAVMNWLGKVDEIIEVVEQLVKDPHHENVGCYGWSFPNLWSRHQLSRNAKKMAKNVVKVQQGKEKFDQIGYMPPLDEIGSTSATKGNEKLKSRKSMKEGIVLALTDPKISRIGVYGLGGVGKTTLVKEVEKKVKDDKLFDAVVIANVSQTPDLKRIQGEIADYLGLHFEEMTTIGKARRLCERIKKEKSILIILDDIWTRLDLEKLEIPSKDNHKGCKLLLTSRNQDILQTMGSEKDFRLDVLNEQEAWSLFEDMTVDVVKDANLHSIATQVAKKCAGLPVLIVAVARALRNKNINHWKDALNQLPRVDNKGMNEIVYSALEFSYNNLDSDEVKELFLLCAAINLNIFEYLLKCVMGLGIFKHIDTLKDARFRLHKLIDSLKASCLLLESNTSEEVKMHDIVSEVALSIASRDQYVFKKRWDANLNKWPIEDLLQKCPHVIILERCHIYKLPERLECPNVKLFYLYNCNSSLGIPNSFFEGMSNLKVLNLTCMHLSSLPKSFCSLTDLQTLCLDQCALGDMTNIGALKNLQILSLYGSSMIRLPSELGQLSLLRMLDLTNSGIEIFPSNIIPRLTKLEELYMGNTFIKWKLENSAEENRDATLAELRHLTNLTALEIQIQEAQILPRNLMFERLERYKIVIGDVWEWSDNYGASKMLKLKLDTSIHLEHGIKELIKGVEDLYLDKINGISNVLYNLNGEGFPLLKHLHIQNNAEIQHIINSMERNQTHILFPNLETLILQNLNNLEKICHGPLTVNSFGRLRVIKIKSCGRLEYLFSVLMVKALSQFLEIKVSKCSSIKKIVFVESVDNGRTIADKIEFRSLRSLTLRHLPIVDDFCSNELTSSIAIKQNSLRNNVPTSFFNAKVKFSNLETLKLSSINLEKIWDDDHLSAAYCIDNLTKLMVEDCRGLKYLFSSSMIESLLNLKELEISKCDMMEEIIDTKGRNGAALEKVLLPNLETIRINEMPELKTIWHPVLAPNSISSLKTMEVSDCEKLENIFPSYMERAFGSLETLTVSDCNSVQEIYELSSEMGSAEDTTRLQKLTLLRLPQLKQIWSRDPQTILRFHNLQVVRVEDCKDLEYLFPFSIAMDVLQLEEITIKQAGKMKEIVSDKEGPVDSPVKFEFNRITSLVLWNLLEFRGFFTGNHSLACPALRKLDVFNCAKLKLFKTQYSGSQGRVSDSKLQVSMQKPLFTLEEVISNLEKLRLNDENASMILQGQFSGDQFCQLKFLHLSEFKNDQTTFPYWFLQNIISLEVLLVEWSSFKEIFQEERPVDENGQIKIGTRIKKLRLHQLHELQHICKEGVQMDPVLEVLEFLYVNQCSNLKHLVPSSVAFSHLICLEVQNCNGLIDLITSSTARSLVKLTTLKIRECNSVEQIVAEEGEESRDEIAFGSLEDLELESLPRLTMFCSSKCFLKLPLLEKFVVRQCPRMKRFSARDTSAPMLRKILTDEQDEKWCWEGDLNGTVNKIFKDMAIREGDEGNYEESSSNFSESSQLHQKTLTTRRASNSEEKEEQAKHEQIVDTGKQEIHKLLSLSDEIEQKEHASSTNPPRIHEDQESQLVEAAQNVLSPTTIQDGAIGTQDMYETIDRPVVQATQKALNLATVHDTAIQSQEMYETIEEPLALAAQNILSPGTIQDIEELHDSNIHPSENLFNNQTTTSMTADYKETIGTQAMCETIKRPLVQATKNALSPPMVHNAGYNVSVEKSHDPEMLAGDDSPNQTTNFVIAESGATFDPSPSQAPEAISSSILALDAYSSYKGMIDIPIQNLPYLEAGVKRHPQVLDWLNTKRRRVFASSFFSLFAEVTRLLRTTRRGDLTKDDQNYIIECCTSLEVVGFDASWLSYVYRCIEECGDGENLKRRLKEAEGQASTLKAQLESIKKELASVEVSLVLLHDKASRLDDFIES